MIGSWSIRVTCRRRGGQADPAQVVAVDGDPPPLGDRKKRSTSPARVLLPAPGSPDDGHVAPPGAMCRSMLRSTGRPSSYAKLTFSNRISPETGGSVTAIRRVPDVELGVEHREDALETHPGRADLGEVCGSG